MKTLFDPSDREALLRRLETLRPDSSRQWGRMDPAQMLAHCALALEPATGERPLKQAFLGKLLTPFIRASVLGEQPFSRNSPTDPSFRVADPQDFDRERARLLDLVDRFVQRGEGEAEKATHAFFGKLSGEEWGRLMHKHLDHHLRQFGA